MVRRPLLWLALVGGAVAMAFVLVLFVAVAADQDARADDGLSGVVCAPPGAPGAAVAGFGGRQLTNAGVVVAVGKQLRLPPRAWVVATVRIPVCGRFWQCPRAGCVSAGRGPPRQSGIGVHITVNDHHRLVTTGLPHQPASPRRLRAVPCHAPS